jgi:predicted Zn-dependent peptidase
MSAHLHRLTNGVRVICDPVPDLETLALTVVVRGGARWEPPNRSGWSHLLEHMVFKGAGSRDARGLVEAIEGAGGQINAATGYERTSFQVRALQGGLPLAMEVLSDLVLRPTLEPEELEREKDVIAQEIAEAFDTPDDWVFELAQGQAFAGQSLGRPILGEVETIGAADRTAVEDWRRRLYASDRLIVAASGAVDEAELLALTEAWFAEAAPAPEAHEPESASFTGGAATLARRLEQAHVVWQLLAPGARDRDYFASRLFAEVLGGGMASRLFQEAREKRGLAYAVDAYAEAYEDVGVLGVYAGCAPAKARELGRLVLAEVEGLAEAPTDGELARAKAQLKGSMFMAQESPLARAERAAGQTLLLGRPQTTRELGEMIDAVTVEDLKRVGERALGERRAAGAVLGPKTAAPAARLFG